MQIENQQVNIGERKRKRRAKKSLEERFEEFYGKPIDEITDEDTMYKPTEYDWGKPVGKEIW